MFVSCRVPGSSKWETARKLTLSSDRLYLTSFDANDLYGAPTSPQPKPIPTNASVGVGGRSGKVAVGVSGLMAENKNEVLRYNEIGREREREGGTGGNRVRGSCFEEDFKEENTLAQTQGVNSSKTQKKCEYPSFVLNCDWDSDQEEVEENRGGGRGGGRDSGRESKKSKPRNMLIACDLSDGSDNDYEYSVQDTEGREGRRERQNRDVDQEHKAGGVNRRGDARHSTRSNASNTSHNSVNSIASSSGSGDSRGSGRGIGVDMDRQAGSPGSPDSFSGGFFGFGDMSPSSDAEDDALVRNVDTGEIMRAGHLQQQQQQHQQQQQQQQQQQYYQQQLQQCRGGVSTPGRERGGDGGGGGGVGREQPVVTVVTADMLFGRCK